MPGLHFAFQKDISDSRNSVLFDKLLKETEYLDGFTSEILLKNQQSTLAVTKSFSEYPLAFFENSQYQVWMEGKIYNLSSRQIQDDLLSISEAIFTEKKTSRLTRWLEQTDGEFVFFVREKACGHWAVFRDLLGSLPLYYSNNEKTIVFSRNLRFTRKYAKTAELDRTALAQYLLFGYLLNYRTFYQNVQPIPPATLLLFDQRACDFSSIVLKQFNYEHKKYRFRSARKNALELSRIFIESCQNRAKSSPQSILKLSGGFDSRAIAAGLHAAKADFTAYTWVRQDLKNQLDYNTAKEVVKTLNIPWHSQKIENCYTEDVRTIFLLKNGIDHLGFSYPVQNAKILQAMFGSKITVFDGLFGDKFMPDLRPPAPLVTFNALLNTVIKKHSIWSLNAIESLMGVKRQDLTDCVTETLSSYPERSLRDKYAHWVIHERGISRFLNCSDRGRNFYWPGLPFLNPAFYHYAMNCPNAQKTNRYLYTLMLKELVPQIIEIPYARNNAAATEPIANYIRKTSQLRFKAEQGMYALKRSPNPIRFLYKKLNTHSQQPPKRKPKPYSPALVKCLQQQADIPDIAQYFSIDQLKRIIRSPEQWGEDALSRLFTILTVVEEFLGANSTLENFPDKHWS